MSMSAKGKGKQGIRGSLVIGDWKLSKKISGGGQGEVWEVRSVSTSNAPPRAMKICVATEPTPRERFSREVGLLTPLRHLNIVPVLDSNLDWEHHEKAGLELAYYVSERFDCALKDLPWLHEAPVISLRLFREVCDAVQYLHTRSPAIVHRDLKPDNILYGSEPRRVGVTDLGIAYRPDQSTDLTAVNEVVGTQHYRSPEVGSGARGDERSDVYSLGRTLEWILTGRVPDLTEPRSIPESSGLSSGAREMIESVLRTACAMDAKARFKSVSQLAQALPDVVADIATGPVITPSDEPSGAFAFGSSSTESYRRVKEVLRTRDAIEWREIQKRQGGELEARLIAWREENEPLRPKDFDEVKGWLDEVFERLGPVIVASLAQAEFPGHPLGNSSAILERMLSFPRWNRGGLTVLVDLPDALAYLVQNLLGALTVAVNDVDGTYDLAQTTLPESEYGGSYRLIERRDLLAFPKSLDRKARIAWFYLLSLPERHRWLLDLFGAEEDFKASVVGYWWRLSFLELAAVVSQERFDELLKGEQQIWFDVPPVWFNVDSGIRERGYRLAFPNGRAVDRLGERAGVDASAIRLRWGEWVKLLYRAAGRSNGGWPLMLDREKPPDLP